jgi:predicted short-subunit dehydrogenase-like oxidoreductase (DUF2520 family)
MKVTIIGAGNVATQLALALKKAGNEIVQIYNRNDEAGKELAHTVGASFTSDIHNLADAEIYLVAVKDDAIAEVGAKLKLGNHTVAHTSGTRSKDYLKGSSNSYGIFYPLQTMTKASKVDFRNVPLLIEGNDAATEKVLFQLAATLSNNVHSVDEQQRQWIHVAAVFANNFTNHLFGVSETILADHGMSFDILKPLIFKFIENLHQYSPSQIQTGPAARGDMQTIEKHMQLLGDDARLLKIYQVLTESIIYSKNLQNGYLSSL